MKQISRNKIGGYQTTFSVKYIQMVNIECFGGLCKVAMKTKMSGASITIDKL